MSSETNYLQKRSAKQQEQPSITNFFKRDSPLLSTNNSSELTCIISAQTEASTAIISPTSSINAQDIRDPCYPIKNSDAEILIGPVQMTFNSNELKARHFRKEWTYSRPWLEYSINQKKAFCFPCRIFTAQLDKTKVSGKDAFAVGGYDDWKHALEKSRGFAKHELSEVHGFCMEMWTARKAQLVEGKASVSAYLSQAFQENEENKRQQRLEDRNYMSKIVRLILRIMKLGLPIRGHNETEDSFNRGVFLELISYTAEVDPLFVEQLKNRPKNAQYTSPQIINQIISCIKSEILTVIVNDINASGVYYSVTMDGTTDVAKKEQESIVVRYCCDDMEIFERLLAVRETVSTTGESLSQLLLSVLEEFNIDKKRLVGQTYDGAAAMTGKKRGVEAIIKNIAPQVIFIHCRAHSANLVTVKACLFTTMGRNFFGICEKIFCLVEGSAKRHAIFQSLQLNKNETPISTKGLSETRWNCQGRSLRVIRNRFSSLLETIDTIQKESSDANIIAEGSGLLKCMMKREFVLSLIFFQAMLHPIDNLTKVVQGRDCDLNHVAEVAKVAHSTLQLLRDEIDNLINESEMFCEENRINKHFVEKRLKKIPKQIDDGLSAQSSMSPLHMMKNACIEVIDIAQSEVTSRFLLHNGALYDIASALANGSLSTHDMKQRTDEIFPDLDSAEIASEYEMCKSSEKWKSASKDIQSKGRSCPTSFKDLRNLYKMILSLPISSAGCERAFSKLKLIKSRLRSTMGEERLESFMLAAIEQDVTAKINMEKIIDRFAALEARKTNLI